MRVLHVATELFPMLKIGGLADVLAALPREQARQGEDVRILLPGLPALLKGVENPQQIPWPEEGGLLLGAGPGGIPLYLLEHPAFSGLDGSPYADGNGPALWRHLMLARAAARLARGGGDGSWIPDVVHAHDWPAGLVPALLAHQNGLRPPTVMTIHNSAYQGLFPAETFPELGLPAEAFSPEGIEFYGRVSLLKAGVRYATKLTAVSPTFAAELTGPEGGMGLEGLFRQRAGDLTGILNGVDMEVWDPARDIFLAAPYDEEGLERRGLNKAALQRELGLDREASAPLFGVVSRLDRQKGLDLLLEHGELLEEWDAQLAVLGQGQPALEEDFARMARARPGRVALVRDQREDLAHRIFAGADFLLVPSRWEPCGLTQMYAMRYGAIPIVRRTGGLADTVADMDAGGDRAAGLVFERPDPEALGVALNRACSLFRRHPDRVRHLQRAAMIRDFGWSRPAEAYRAVYRAMAEGV